MTPRSYTQDRRAETTAVTRRRIHAAAAELFREHGVTGTTIQAIAERADVARGTVINHFGSFEALLESLLDEAVEDIRFPDETILDGAPTEEARIRRFVDAMFRFFERSTAWWSVFAADRNHPAVAARERAYWDVVARLHEATFGTLAGDRFVQGAVAALVDYAPMNAFRTARLGLDEMIEVVGDALVDLVARRRQGGASPDEQRRGGTS